MHTVRPEQGIGARLIATAVGLASAERGLAEHEIGRHVAGARRLAPDQHPVIPGIGDDQTIAAGADAGRHVQCRGARFAFGVAAFVLKIRLADEPIGRRAVAVRCARPTEQPMVAGIANPERAVGTEQAGTARAK